MATFGQPIVASPNMLPSTANVFSASTAYSAGDYVWYNGKLYCFTADHAAGAWTGSDASEAKLADDIADLKSQINEISEKSKNILPKTKKTATVNNVGTVYEDGTLTISGTANNSGGRLNVVIGTFTLPAGKYTLSRTPKDMPFFLESGSSILGQLNANNESVTFTTDSEKTVFIGINVVNNTAYDATYSVQLEAGEPATPIHAPSWMNAVDETARTSAAGAYTYVDTLHSSSVYAMSNNGGITNANDAVMNRIYLLIDVSGVSNLPVSMSGILLTYGKDSTATTQLYMTSDDSFFFRRKWGTSWSEWRQFLHIGDARTLLNHLYVLQAFDNLTCCGDSLTYSQVYTAAAASRQALVPYPKVLEKLTGTPTTALATAGYSASDWWTAYSASITAKTNQCAIIYLGANGGFTETLDTDAPENADPSTWANTNTGCLAKMIAGFQSVGAKVILVKCYTTSGTGTSDLTHTNATITAAATRFGCGLAENQALTADAYHYYPDRSGTNPVHYNDLGYSAFAKQLADNIASMDKNFLKYLIPDAT